MLYSLPYYRLSNLLMLTMVISETFFSSLLPFDNASLGFDFKLRF